MFIVIESMNVLALYFSPGTKYANSVGMFVAWEKSKQYPEIHQFIRYLVYWVAGVKVMVLFLLAMLVIFAEAFIIRNALLVLGVATATFFWRLFPIIRTMDKNEQIKPMRYSIGLAIMILIFIAVFFVSYIVYA
jgi:hypothetical protein